MAKYLVEDTSLIAIADAIRSKTSKPDKLSLGEMVEAIAELGGSGDTETTATLNALIDRSITEIRSDVEKVGDYAFQSCLQLSTADFPVVASIGTQAFRSCLQLSTIDFPVVASIGSSAFYGCSQLTTLTLRAEKSCSLSATNAFASTPIASGTGYIYVPSSLVDSYKSATNWSTYAAQFRALEDYTVDGTITGELDTTKIGA